MGQKSEAPDAQRAGDFALGRILFYSAALAFRATWLI